jgi:AraC family transcriptional regulator of adaptative response/methylated-DNA-[protein]-cysteine methyltransferase
MTLTAEENHINYQRIEQAIVYLEKNFKQQPDLDEVAEKVNLSPFHFQRLFTEWAGISPKRFLQFLTVNFLKEKLQGYRVSPESMTSLPPLRQSHRKSTS